MTATQVLAVETTPVWEPPPPPTDLIFDDGEPLETNRHRIAMNLLIRSYQQFRGNDSNYFTGGNMFVYFSSAQVRNRDYKGPDFFVVLDIDPKEESRQGWVVWEEGGRYPDVIVELLSPSTALNDRTTKKVLYEQVFRTRNYFIYNPFNPAQLQGWQLGPDLRYEPLVPSEQGWLWCETLGLWLGAWAGTIEQDPAVWLRFFDQQGQVVPLPEEAAQAKATAAQVEAQAAQAQAEMAHAAMLQEQQRADRLAAQLRRLGIDPDQG